MYVLLLLLKMFPSRSCDESLPFSEFPHYLYTSTNNHALGAIHERSEAPSLFPCENVYYNDGLVNNGNVSFPSRVVEASSVGKKDKHSKIVTAKGPRDRRVRLSIEVSKKFFGLQDMLGFDKASKTIDWLFTKSKIDIEELSQKQTRADVDLVGQAEKSARELRRAEARARARERTRRKNQSLSMTITSKCNTCTTTKVDVEMDTQFCNNQQELCHMTHMSSSLSVIPPKEATHHGDILLLSPCATTRNAWEASWQP